MSIVIDGPPPGGPSPPEGTFVGANLQKTAEGIDLARHFVEPGNGKLAYPMSSSGTPGGHLVNLTVRTLDKKEHHMSVAHDIPVPQLKTEVASITSIDAESQVPAPVPSSLCCLPPCLRRLYRASKCVDVLAFPFPSDWFRAGKRCRWMDGSRTTAHPRAM
jgi:hypothetical protein